MIGSMASHTGIPGAPMYSAAKHAVLGLFRSLYFDGQIHGIKYVLDSLSLCSNFELTCVDSTNIICPWFTDTGIVTPLTRAALIGLPLCTVDDVVSAVIRSAADQSFSGNTVVIDAKYVFPSPSHLIALFPMKYIKLTFSLENKEVSSLSPTKPSPQDPKATTPNSHVEPLCQSA